MDQITSLPTSVKVLLATLSAGLIAALVYIIDSRATVFVLIGIVVVIVLFLLYLWILHLIRKRQAAQMSGDMSQHSTVIPRGVSDPSQRAKLDNLRRNFQTGVSKFREAGKDIYKLPWYVVVGEPGAGKTEAIRHSNVGFPPGMQDELQGAGGTINMNWWFTNQAVLLDTAGKLMFEQVPAGSSNEWLEFLKLLKKSRPECPVNGLILAIPADSLIKNSADEIVKKAQRIAEQLSTIQKALDVRFPVFVLITKTDLINGFREFFEHVKDPQLQHQILGWSNPADLDAPFQPEQVDQYLQQVVTRVRRRRLGLLQDPTPRGEGPASSNSAPPWAVQPTQTNDAARRLDEVDALFALPTSLGLLAPRLRRYLELIFVPNEWSGKPLFLRGIYFTSAMREGSALDLELANAVGVPVDTLPDGRMWARESAYFLRDLFLEKIFKEKGLVTRASNTRRMLRRRQWIFFACGFAGLAVLLACTLIYKSSLDRSVGTESLYWMAASKDWQKDGTWTPVVAEKFRGKYDFMGAREIAISKDHKVKLTDFHQELATRVQKDIEIPWVFAPMGSWLNGANAKRREAQRILFEGGVVKPIILATRATVVNSRDNWSPASSDALAFLVRLEGMIYRRSSGLSSDDLSADGFLKPAAGFLYSDTKSDPALSSAFEWTYLNGGDGRGYWPPRWLSAGFSIDKNTFINDGLVGFLHDAGEREKLQEVGFAQIKNVRTEVRTLRQVEDDLVKVCSQPNPSADALESAYAAYLRQKNRLDLAMAEASKSGPFPPGPILLFGSYKGLVDDVRKQTDKAFKQLDSEIVRLGLAVKDNPKEAPFTLATDISQRILTQKQKLQKDAETSFAGEELTELQELDKLYLDKTDAGEQYFIARTAGYEAAMALQREPSGTLPPLLGTFGKQLDQVSANIKTATEKGDRYQGGYATGFHAVLRPLLSLAQTRRVEGLYDRYLGEIDGTLKTQAGFPVLGDGAHVMSLPELRTVAVTMKSARTDLPTLHAAPPARLSGAIDHLQTRVDQLSLLCAALVTDDGQPAKVTVILPRVEEQKRRFGSSGFLEKFLGYRYREVRLGGKKVRSENTADQELATLAVTDPAPMLDFGEPDEAKPKASYPLGGSGDWSLLRLLNGAPPLKLADGKVWSVSCKPQVKDARGAGAGWSPDWELTLEQKSPEGTLERSLLLVLHFEKPLPDAEHWPMLAQTQAKL